MARTKQSDSKSNKDSKSKSESKKPRGPHPLDGITKSSFVENAPTITMTLSWEGQDPISYKVDPKIYGTGSIGWGLNAKVDGPAITVASKDYPQAKLTVGVNLTINNSKELPDGSDASAEEDSEDEKPKKKKQKRSKKKDDSDSD